MTATISATPRIAWRAVTSGASDHSATCASICRVSRATRSAAASTASMRSCNTICDAGCSKRSPASHARCVRVQGLPPCRLPCRRRKPNSC